MVCCQDDFGAADTGYETRSSVRKSDMPRLLSVLEILDNKGFLTDNALILPDLFPPDVVEQHD